PTPSRLPHLLRQTLGKFVDVEILESCSAHQKSLQQSTFHTQQSTIICYPRSRLPPARPSLLLRPLWCRSGPLICRPSANFSFRCARRPVGSCWWPCVRTRGFAARCS